MRDTRELIRLESGGVLTVGANKDRMSLPFNGEFVNASAAVSVASVTTNVVIDLLKNGVSIYTTVANRPRVVAGSVASAAANLLRPDVFKFVPGDVLSLSIISVGPVTAGSDLVVSVQFTPV